MSDKKGEGQSGGINFGQGASVSGGEFVGRDKILGTPSAAALDETLRPVLEAIKAGPPQAQVEAEAKLAALKQEAAKGKDANDGVMARLVDGLVALIPGAASAVGSAFATPLLGGLVGPVTSFVIDKLRGK
ncbi:MAG: hypothetical protein ACREFP_17765 [Acetobacteraceae bacterium]